MDAAADTPGDPFAFPIAHHPFPTRAAIAAARPFVSWLLQLPLCRSVYGATQDRSGDPFERRALRALGITVEVEASDGAIPAHGPLIVAANHPTGLVDGLLMLTALRTLRPDVRLLANHLLARIPELRSSCFFVDPFGGSAAPHRSQRGLRAAHLWLRGGGALIAFPAGEVAWRTQHGRCIRTDSPWLPTIGRLALATAASVLPAFVEGWNSPFFYAAGRVHPRLRTLLLPRELLNKRGATLRVTFGRPFAATETATDRTGAAAVTDHARRAVDALAIGAVTKGDLQRVAEVAPAVDPELLVRDVDALPGDTLLLASGDFDVFCADAVHLPHVLREIGRLREITFRRVGEGTGTAIDLDRFDEHYAHLFVWHRARREVVGSYRIGFTDRILCVHGVQGLYTRTLFRYDERMMHRMSPALELGRSFVREEYQRSYQPLLLLWKGIGRLVARAPQYRVLFGPVSISSRYTDTSQQMLRAFLAQQHSSETLSGVVEPMNPPPTLAPPARGAAAVADVDRLDAVIAKLEGGQGIPVLLRQYLKLNATLLGFNLDPAFGDALDALMMVDLTRVPVSTLNRYLGRADTAAFLDRHRSPQLPAASFQFPAA